MVGCIEWQGSKDRDGYGQINYEGVTKRAHRVVYCDYHNIVLEDIDNLVVMHTCDNPSCINPNHLTVGTQKDNVRDMLLKGRRYDSSGENNPRAIVDATTVNYIRKNYIKGHKEFGGAALGRRFGLAKTSVFHIINGSSWSTV